MAWYNPATWITTDDTPVTGQKGVDPQIAADYDLTKQRRRRAAQLYGERTSDLQGQIGQYQSARGQLGQTMAAEAAQGQRDIERQGAQARADASAAGGGSSASNYGALLQAGQNIGAQQASARTKAAADLAAFNADTQAGVMGLQNDYRTAQLEEQQALAQMGTETENTQKRLADVQAQVYAIEDNIRKNGSYFGEQEEGARQVQMLALREPDPAVRAWLEDRAAAILAGDIDV
jgi:hypothetical protein